MAWFKVADKGSSVCAIFDAFKDGSRICIDRKIFVDLAQARAIKWIDWQFMFTEIAVLINHEAHFLFEALLFIFCVF